MLIIASSCEINSYQPVHNEERTDVIKQEIKKEPSEWDIFVEALIQVESEGKADAVGKTNDVGILQITPIYVKDVNRILGEERYTLSCRTDIEKSLEMFEILQSHYNPNKDINKAIKLHNPRAGQSYRIKIMNKMENIKQIYHDKRRIEKEVSRSYSYCELSNG
jgi:alpha-mannosidase